MGKLTDFLSKDQLLLWLVSATGAMLGFGVSNISTSLKEMSVAMGEIRSEVLVTKVNLSNASENMSRRIEESREWIEKLSHRIGQLERREAATRNENP